MGCLKCGKNAEDQQSFCPECLKAMEPYPVKSDVAIQLPKREVSPAPKKAARKRRVMTAEEQAAGLRKRARRLTALAALLLVLLAASLALLVYFGIAAGGFALLQTQLFHVKQLG